MKSSSYFFLLGRTPELSVAELTALMKKPPITLGSNFARTDFATDEEAIGLFSKLGGSLKVMRLVGKFSLIDREKMQEYVTAYLADLPRPTFAVAEFGFSQQERVSPIDIKRQLKERNVASRFIDGPREGLSASILLHQEVAELNLIRNEDSIFLTQTLAVQDIDDWTKRDRAKPYANRKKGMLPPKVARIMVNLALGQRSDLTLYDPFCGTGTLLLEGLMRDCRVIGSDLDTEAVKGAQLNAEWLCHEYHRQENFSIFHADVSRVDRNQLPEPIDAIVTEPFLGKQTPDPKQLPNIFKGLGKLYLGAFKQWQKILKPAATVVIIFPYAENGSLHYSLEEMIDKFGALGYTPISQPIIYSRPDAVVKRQIWQFVYGKK